MPLPRPVGPGAKRPSTPPKYAKPAACEGCSIQHLSTGYVPPYLHPKPKVLFVGEAPGWDEGIHGEPFIGAAGSMLIRVLKLLGRQREEFDYHNVYNCVLPGGTSERQHWAQSAREHCRYLDSTLAQRPKVIVPLGSVALKRVLNLFGHPDVKVEGFHGAPIWSEEHQAWVVTSYHPSHLQRGAVNLMGVSAFDYARAFEIADKGWAPDPMRLVMDPPIAWFRKWADDYIAAVKQDPYAYPLANDIETPDRSADEADDLTTARDKSFTILRQNFSCHPDEGVTIPYVYPYIPIIHEVLEAGGTQYLWFKGFDVPRQKAAGIRLREDLLYDCMWMAKVIQSDLPQGLGFWAPFHSTFGPWKHLAKTDPIRYACIDGPQTRRVGDGLVGDLIQTGQWHVFQRHQHDFHRIVLQPAQDVGLPIDRVRLSDFKLKLDKEAMRLQDEIQLAVPPELFPLTPKGGLTRPPTEGDVHTKARAETKKGVAKKDPPDPLKMALFARSKVVERLILKEVNRCTRCGALEIAKSHRCDQMRAAEGEGLVAPVLGWIDQVPATVTRWFWQEPFNPDSPPQVLELVKHWKLQPGRDKHSGKDSVDRETLNKLLSAAKGKKQETQVGFFSGLLDYKAVAKVRSTYVVGTEKRLDATARIHGQVTFKPSTMRTSMVSPNLQNVVADKGGKESLAAGFRHCVVARGQWEEPCLVESEMGPVCGAIVHALDVHATTSAAVWRGSKIIELDYAGIEAVILGWCMRDWNYARIAKLGMHAYLASYVLGRPADLTWPDEQLAAYFRAIKDDDALKMTYDGCKRVVHGNGYGQTALGTYLAHPKLFRDQAAADRLFKLYYEIAPSLPAFHMALRHSAHEKHCLGGAKPYYYNPAATPKDKDYLLVEGHPYAYKHWFWSVVHYERLNEGQRLWRVKRNQPVMEFNGITYGVGLGEDAKRVCALYPQGIARGVLTEATFPLFDREDPEADQYYIGDAYFGRTPLRAPIHDSLLMEVPTRMVERVVERGFAAMERPIPALPLDTLGFPGQCLTIGVDGKVGDDWGKMEKISPKTAHQKAIDWGVAADVVSTADDPDEEDDMADLETRMGAA
jgi:uracil-DNA glycosylase family 4